MSPSIVTAASLALSIAAANTLAQGSDTAMESDWLELVKGYKGDAMGAEIEEITQNPEDNTRKVTVSIPKSSVADPDTIEEVVVVGKAPQKPERGEPIPVRYEWVRDYDEDSHGLVIHVGEGNWPIRLFMSADQDVNNPNR